MASDSGEPPVATKVPSSTSGEPLLAFADALLSAGVGAEAPALVEMRQVLTFFLGDEEYAVPILDCREILRVGAVTRIPEAPSHVRGIVNLRGRIVPAVDGRLCMGMVSVPATPKSRFIVVEAVGRRFALLVDRVARILKVALPEVGPPARSVAMPAVLGAFRVGQETIHLLDVEILLRLKGVPRAGEEM